MDLRKKLGGTNLVGAAWCFDWLNKSDKPVESVINIGVYHTGDGGCQECFGQLCSNHKKGTVFFILNKKVLDQFGIKLIVKE